MTQQTQKKGCLWKGRQGAQLRARAGSVTFFKIDF